MTRVNEEMFTIKQTIAHLLKAQAKTKRRNTQLKEASTVLDKILEWSNKYPQDPTTFPRRDWIATQNEKVQFRMKVQSKENLIKDMEKVMLPCEHFISGIDSMAEVHHIPSLGALGEEKTWEEVSNYIQIFLQPIRQAAASQDLSTSRENRVQLIVTPVRI